MYLPLLKIIFEILNQNQDKKIIVFKDKKSLNEWFKNEFLKDIEMFKEIFGLIQTQENPNINNQSQNNQMNINQAQNNQRQQMMQKQMLNAMNKKHPL